MRSQPPTNVSALASGRFQYRDAMTVSQFPRGSANLTYRLAFAGLHLVLRRPPFGKIAPGAHDMHREYTILSKLWQAWPRAPRAYVLCEDVEVIGAPFVVQEYRDGGVVIFGEAPPSMADLPDLGTRLVTAMADALADLHKVDYAAVGLADLGKPEGFVERQVAGWRDRWSRVASAECGHRYVAMGERLAAEMPQSGPPALIHNDYKLDNCQFRPGDPERVASVFDWDGQVVGVFWGMWTGMNQDRFREEMQMISDFVAGGKFTPMISEHFALEDAPKALARMRGRGAIGKLVVTVSE